jgi:hypothetical protein
MVVGVGKVNSCRVHFVELLALAWDRVGQFGYVEDLRAAEAGDCSARMHVRLETDGLTTAVAAPG